MGDTVSSGFLGNKQKVNKSLLWGIREPRMVLEQGHGVFDDTQERLFWGRCREWTSSVASMEAQSDEDRAGCIAGSLSCILFALLFLNILFLLFCVYNYLQYDCQSLTCLLPVRPEEG